MSEEDYLWVARDESGHLYLYEKKPVKYNKTWYFSKVRTGCFKLNPALFPNVKCEDEEPLAVVLQQAIFKSK